MGHVIQVGHDTGESCPLPRYSNAKKFVIIDVDGVHLVRLKYCGCGHADPSYDLQLLEARLYPSTTVDPETCATFRALEHFQMISFMSKVRPLAIVCLTITSQLIPRSRRGSTSMLLAALVITRAQLSLPYASLVCQQNESHSNDLGSIPELPAHDPAVEVPQNAQTLWASKRCVRPSGNQGR